VSADYYQRALNQDLQMAAVANAAALAAPVAVELSDRTRTLTVAWPQGEEFSGSITLYRASNADADRVVLAAPGIDGRQDIDLTSYARGRWQVQLRWRVGQREYYVERDIELR
jgi:hypothetical protein